MTGYSGSAAEDIDYARRESENEPPIEALLTEEELAEREADFEQIAAQLHREEFPLSVPLATSVQLTREDSDALRAYTAKLMAAVIRWQYTAVQYSSMIQQLIATGDGNNVIRAIRDASPERAAANEEVFKAVVTTWRLALLTSPDLTAENLEYWLSEYVGIAQPIEPPSND